MVRQQSLYRRVLGAEWDRLPTAIRTLHETSDGQAIFRGRATIERGKGSWGRLTASVFGFPVAGENVPVEIRFECANGREIWTRRFGEKVLRSSQQKAENRKERLLAEGFGPFRILCALEPVGNRLHLRVRGWSFLGLPLPALLAPGGRTFEEDRDGLFHFHVQVESPLTGLIVRYRGWLKADDEAPSPIANVRDQKLPHGSGGHDALMQD
ncbi:DUF4166 domain-containing protein [Ensifer sp. ENS11]|uniref:DUF4166 domain-containing protein n=1 Tax=Ensifer sp. ENS11 TaxID=2769291 RepID=UPI00046CB239|nr:DUF4166 domain-containing protein [Ensifer sp. ENS11]MBD9486912.1 DUF4166 domain-containing protein [Ensifer sp. ENS11]